MEKKERRRFKRIKKNLYIQCHLFGTTTSWHSATVQDISETGISVSTMKEFTRENVLEMKISTFLKPKPINVLGKVVSCEEKGSAGIAWVTHISFTHIDEEGKPLLQELVQIFSKTEEGK